MDNNYYQNNNHQMNQPVNQPVQNQSGYRSPNFPQNNMGPGHNQPYMGQGLYQPNVTPGVPQTSNYSAMNLPPIGSTPNSPVQGGNGMATAALILGIFGLVSSVLGGILFGVIGAGFSIIFSIIGTILSINTKKNSNGQKGTAAMICSIIGLSLGGFFLVSCITMGIYGDSVNAFGFVPTWINFVNNCYGC